MAKTVEDIEGYLIRLELPYEEVGRGTWVINDQQDKIENIVISYNPPLIIFRVHVMDIGDDVPREKREELFQELLKLNATEMVAGAYGLENDKIVLTDTLQAENLDYNEFQASVDAVALAIVNHYPKLARFRGQAAA
jgi:hypothetical protein